MALRESKTKKWLGRLKSKVKESSPLPAQVQAARNTPTATFLPPFNSPGIELGDGATKAAAVSPDKIRELLQPYDYGLLTGGRRYPTTLYVALAWAAGSAFDKLVIQLLDLGALLLPTPTDLQDYHEVTGGDNCISPLHAAIRSRGNQMSGLVSSLLKSLSSEGTSRRAVEADRAQLLQMHDHDGMTPIACAARYADADTVVHLLDNGATIDDRDDEGQTPLHHTSKVWNHKVVRLLLDRGASIECRDTMSRTPLHAASRTGHGGQIVRFLLERGAALENRDSQGRTPLHLASLSASCHVVGILLDSGASIESRDDKGLTPLYLASRTDSYHKMVSLLLDRGASLDVRDDERRTPLQHSSSMNKKELLLRGADATVLSTSDFAAPESAVLERKETEDSAQRESQVQKSVRTSDERFAGVSDSELLRWD